MKPVLISGIQPTGKLHIGNYLGSLQNFVELQNSGKYECYFFIADLHSLTENFDPKEKPDQIMDVALDYLAAGLDPKKSVIFQQSEIPAHSELQMLLSNITPFGELRRMTQFKDKSESQPENANVGLFNYPVLMAADILLYDAKFVPVGEDQLQHLELTRTLARKFNLKFGKIFLEPQPILTEAKRIMSLDDPTKKMSKSRPAGCLFLDDDEKTIKEKIKRAVTDSGHEIKYDPEDKPAISNLIIIYSNFSGITIKQTEKKFENKGYGDFKKDISEEIIKNLSSFQIRKKKLIKNKTAVKKIIISGNKRAGLAATKKIEDIKIKLGLTID